MTAVRIILAALPLLVLAGCSGATEDKGVPLEKSVTGNYRIGIMPTMQFSPPHGNVPVGATVEWLHNGGGDHDVTDADHTPPLWSSYDSSDNGTVLKFGETYTRTFAQAGTYHYKCAIHEGMGMVGTLTVG